MSFVDNKAKVLSFMEAVEEERLMHEADEAFLNSPDYKLKVLDREEQKARDYCLDEILGKIYNDAIPLNGEYKDNNVEDINTAFKTFMDTRCPKGMEWYIREGLKKGSPFAKRVLEAVDELVKDEYHDRAMGIDDINSDDLVFRSSEDLSKRLDVIGQDLSAPEISQAVQDNVKQTALSEISRAKKEKETLKNLEKELAGDASLTSQAAVESALALHDIGTVKDYEPTLFEGIMVGKLNKYKETYESGICEGKNIYGALKDFGRETTENPSIEEMAFIESVEEYTALSVLKALRLESFTARETAELALEYAQK